ncbi:MAG: stalk domain-containing protein, partial [Bacillota bacterium]|nr:stalk domain-containing protein [Bacillota bacterium]
MKRLTVFMVIVAMVIGILPSAAAQASTIEVYYKGSKIAFDAVPKISNGRTMVPMRAIFETLGYTIDWNGDNGIVTANKDNTTIVLNVGSEKATVNSKELSLDAPPFIDNGRVLVPLRFVGESAGYDVLWDGDNHKVYIEQRNPNEYDSVQDSDSVAVGSGNSILYVDYDKDNTADVYSTTFDSDSSVRVLDGDEAYNDSASMIDAKIPKSYSITPYVDGKAYVSFKQGMVFDVDIKEKSSSTTKINDINPVDSPAPDVQKVFDGYLYFFYKGDSFYRTDLATGKTEQLDCSTSAVID